MLHINRSLESPEDHKKDGKERKNTEQSQDSDEKLGKNYSTRMISQKNGEDQEAGLTKQISLKEVVTSDLMYKFPPDFELARIHGDARRVKNLDQCEYEKSKLTDSKYFCP